MKYLLSSLLLATCVQLNAQHDKCATHDLMLHQESLTPGYMQSVEDAFNRAKENQSGDRATLYTIPVVVHIVYEDAAENLDDSVIFNQIQRLNEDFRRLNADTVNTRNDFLTIVGDSEIEFELATVDPDGNPTTGITRTSTTVGSFLAVGGFPAEGVKSTADGGIDPWNQADYLNIWVCDMSLFGTPSILGYATPPNNLPHWPAGSSDNMSDGVVIQYQAFGANNPNILDAGGGPIDVQGRTLVHEVGHYLGLRHIWGDGGCTEEDGIDDTPNAADQANQTCNFSSNTCTDNIGTLGDLPDMVENYMDYSTEVCQNSFTLGQIDMMRSIIENYRWELVNGTPASTSELSQFDFGMFPNPTSDVVTITGIPQDNTTLTIYSKSGQVIRQIVNPQSTEEIGDLPKGMYIVQLLSEQGSAVKKLIVL